MTEINSAVGKVTSIGRIAYRKLTDAPFQLTDGGKGKENPSLPFVNLFMKTKKPRLTPRFLLI